jgi:sugar O-acyltransferase (sialic acid O-acetyltransferase NeuD family)
MLLFGAYSPVIVDIEETLLRLDETVSAAVSVSGIPRVTITENIIELAFFKPNSREEFLPIAFAPVRREQLVRIAISLGLVLSKPIIDPTAIVASTARVGAGSYINASVTIGGCSRFGEGVFINRSASIGHHCQVGDFVSIGPGAVLAGNISVGNGSLIGAGAVVLPNMRIGAGSIVAAGAVVRAHVPAGVIVEGHPARRHPLKPEKSALSLGDGE